MFENLRNAFREALENFNKELKRDQVPETVDKLLSGMRNEVADAKVRIKELEDQIARAVAETSREEKAAETARRRGTMAREIADEETAGIADEYADKHEERTRLLRKKTEALKEELAFLKKDVEEMLEKVKAAQTKRDTLAATAGRTDARGSIEAADDLFSELDRMAEKIGDEDARAQAAEAFDDMGLGPDPDFDPPPSPEVDLDARLEELKRRMGEE